MFKKINKYRCKNFHMHSSTVHQFTKIQIHCQFSDQSINLKKTKNLCDIKKELGREENQTFFLSILLYGSD